MSELKVTLMAKELERQQREAIAIVHQQGFGQNKFSGDFDVKLLGDNDDMKPLTHVQSVFKSDSAEKLPENMGDMDLNSNKYVMKFSGNSQNLSFKDELNSVVLNRRILPSQYFCDSDSDFHKSSGN